MFRTNLPAVTLCYWSSLRNFDILTENYILKPMYSNCRSSLYGPLNSCMEWLNNSLISKPSITVLFFWLPKKQGPCTTYSKLTDWGDINHSLMGLLWSHSKLPEKIAANRLEMPLKLYLTVQYSKKYSISSLYVDPSPPEMEPVLLVRETGSLWSFCRWSEA